MQAPGFWDDQARAAKVSAEHARLQKQIETFRSLESDLDDFEELTEEGDYKDRKFPCAEFRLERQKNTGEGIGIEPLSPFFGVEAEFPPFTSKDIKAGLVPADGTILTQAYDVLKERIANRPMK